MGSTSNPIGSPDFRDAYLNASNLDRAMNSEEDNWRDRFGIERKTYNFLERQVTDIKDELATELGSQILGFKQSGEGGQIIPVETIFQERVSVIQFVGVDPTGIFDSTDGIQNAVTAAGIHRVVYFPYGKYKITGKIFIPRSTTWIFESGAELDCNVGGMVINFENYLTNTIGRYDFGSRISFVCLNGKAKISLGGDKITTGYRGFFTAVHSKNIYVYGIDFHNGRETHVFEFNSCQNVLVDNSGFYGNFPLDMASVYGYEAIQIDYSSQSGAPSGPPWDGTPCENILITNSRFDMCHGGIGSHAVNPDTTKPHKRINFINNDISRCIYPIKCTNLHESLILENRINAAFQRGVVIDSCNDLTLANSRIYYNYDGSGAKLSNSAGGIGVVINNYVPNGYKSENIQILDNHFDSFYRDEELGLYNSGMLYATMVDKLTLDNNIIKNINKTAMIFANADNIEATRNKFWNCGVAGDRDVIRIEAGVEATPRAYIAQNFIDGVGASYSAIRCLSKGTNVRYDRNRFGPNTPTNKRYLGSTLTALGYTFNDIQNLTPNGDFVTNTLIALPCSVYELESIIVGAGTVGNGFFMSYEGFPFSRETGFRITDYVAFLHISGGTVRIDVIDEFTLKVISTGTSGVVRWIKGRKL